MKRCFFVAVLFFLVGCKPVAEIKDRGAEVVQPVIDTAKSIQKRAETVKTGIQMVRDGVHAIGSGTKVSW